MVCIAERQIQVIKVSQDWLEDMINRCVILNPKTSLSCPLACMAGNILVMGLRTRAARVPPNIA